MNPAYKCSLVGGPASVPVRTESDVDSIKAPNSVPAPTLTPARSISPGKPGTSTQGGLSQVKGIGEILAQFAFFVFFLAEIKITIYRDEN